MYPHQPSSTTSSFPDGDVDDNGIAYVESELVPEGMEELAREGAAACPQLAITVTEIDD